MTSTTRTEPQRAASRCNGSRSTGPRSTEGRVRSSMNRTVHGLNSARLLLATEDVAEYQQHVSEWVDSLSPSTTAERQIVLLVADMMWRVKRIGRIEERRALAILDDLLERSPEWRTRAKFRDVLAGLDLLANLVATSAVPVPTAALAGFLGGVAGVVQLVDELRDALPVGMWPDAEVCTFLRARNALAKDADGFETVCDTFTALGASAATLATALRALAHTLDAAVEKARSALSTEHLLADDEDRRFERHRRILEASVSRQLDLLTKVRTMAASTRASGSSEHAVPVELRVIGR